jgi:hypothetical protein
MKAKGMDTADEVLRPKVQETVWAGLMGSLSVEQCSGVGYGKRSLWRLTKPNN